MLELSSERSQQPEDRENVKNRTHCVHAPVTSFISRQQPEKLRRSKQENLERADWDFSKDDRPKRERYHRSRSESVEWNQFHVRKTRDFEFRRRGQFLPSSFG